MSNEKKRNRMPIFVALVLLLMAAVADMLRFVVSFAFIILTPAAMFAIGVIIGWVCLFVFNVVFTLAFDANITDRWVGAIFGTALSFTPISTIVFTLCVIIGMKANDAAYNELHRNDAQKKPRPSLPIPPATGTIAGTGTRRI